MSRSRTLTFLGTGTSVGVPRIGCDCSVCTSDEPRNQRYRSSVLIRTSDGNILIDTGPEMRLQLLREKVEMIHSVLYTHHHADHIFGLDDLRIFPIELGAPLPIYCSKIVETVIRQAFPYAFDELSSRMPAGFVPKLEFRRFQAGESFPVLGESVQPIPLVHSRFECYGFRIGGLAYCTDVNEIPPSSMDMLRDLDVFITDALRYKPHPAHQSVEEALAVIDVLKPRRAFFTHMGHELDYRELNPTLPPGVEMAYDGLNVEF